MKDKLIAVKDFSPEELRKWQMRLLEILVYFRDFCESHQLRFFLAGGTLIGAVRHHGFIPWDDDVDVQMFREDYEKLLKLWDKEADTSRFKCCTTTKDVCCRFPMTVIRSTNTTCIYNHSVNDDICQGLKIDVEFLDAVPNDKFNRTINVICAHVFALYRAQRFPRRVSRLKRYVSRLIYYAIPSKTLKWKISEFCEKRIRKYNKDSTCENVRYLFRPPYKKDVYNETLWIDFEGYKMPIPAGYDHILRAAYGDYLKLPPEDKRKPLTYDLIFCDLDHSYLDYKGKYYCVKG